MLEVKTGANLRNCCVSDVTRDHVMTHADLAVFPGGAAGGSVGVLGVPDVSRDHVMTRDLVVFPVGAAGGSVRLLGVPDVPRNTADV